MDLTNEQKQCLISFWVSKTFKMKYSEEKIRKTLNIHEKVLQWLYRGSWNTAQNSADLNTQCSTVTAILDSLEHLDFWKKLRGTRTRVTKTKNITRTTELKCNAAKKLWLYSMRCWNSKLFVLKRNQCLWHTYIMNWINESQSYVVWQPKMRYVVC